MTNAIGMTDFFVLEAGEYLERLDALAQTAAGAFDPVEEFVRIARAFRGSALMASQQSMARAAQGLESVGRAVRDGRLAWDEAARGAVVRAVDDCKVLLRKVRSPSDEDAAKAEALGAELERLAGRPAQAGRAAGEGLDAGARAFVAREAATIASALDRAARALAADPGGRAALLNVTQVMSALRGVAVLNDLPPLGDILIGVEGAVREVYATSGEVREAVPEAFDAGAKALARAAREVVDIGRPATDSEEAAAFAGRLLGAFASSGHIVPIEMLFYDDAGPHVVKEGVAPAGISPVEAVSHGEFLAGAAAGLQRAASPVLRDLRLFGIAASLRPLAGAGGSPLASALGRLADAGRGAIERGAAAANLSMFVALIAQAAETLRTAAGADEAALGTALDSASAELIALEAAAAPAPAAAPTELPFLVTPEEAAAPPPEPAAAGTPLAVAYTALARLTAERAMPAGALEDLFGAPAEPGIVPVEALAPSAPSDAEAGVVPIEWLSPSEPPVAAAEIPADDADVVPIESLLYGGTAALQRALQLQPEIEALLATRSGDAEQVAALLREVFDLVQLGTGAAR
jgi:chemotaxis protein histidine kinase CheA